MHRRVFGVATATLLLILTACTRPAPVDPGRDTLRIGVLPDQDSDVLVQRYAPLIDYLRETLAIEIDLVIPDSYRHLVALFSAGELDLAWFGGLTFVEAERAAGAVPLVLRDVDLEFTSDFLVPTSTKGAEVSDVMGGSLAFGPELSTSGNLMARYFLRQGGIDPSESFATTRHSSGHDETALWVQDGLVDVGVANSIVVASMFRDGRLDASKVRILCRTPAYRDYVWAASRDLDAATKGHLLDAFLALDRTVPAHGRILTALGAGAFMPACRSHYDEIRAAAQISARKGTIR